MTDQNNKIFNIFFRLIDRGCSFISRSRYLSLVLIIGLFYSPAFFVPFAYHNDGGLISGPKGDLLRGFNEEGWDFMIGRPLQSLFLGLQTTLTANIFCLSVARVLSFVLLGASSYILCCFLIKRCAVDKFWARLISLTILFLPVSILDTIWASELATGAWVVFLVMLTYKITDSPGPGPVTNKFRLVLVYSCSALLFFISLLFYPPISVLVFVFTLLYLILSKASLEQLRRIYIRDICLYGVVMCLYVFFVKTVILTLGARIYPVRPAEGMYKLDMASSLLLKFPLFQQIATHLFKGPFSLLHGWWGMGFMGLTILGVVVLRRVELLNFLDQARASFQNRAFYEKLILGAMLFFLANTPVLMAAGCLGIPGYRVLFPVGLIWCAVVYKLLMDSSNALASQRAAFVLFFILFLLSAATVGDVVYKNVKQDRHMVHQLKNIDLSAKRRILFFPRQERDLYGGWDTDLDLGLFFTTNPHILFYIQKFLPSSSPLPVVQDGDRRNRFYITPDTAIIDLDEEDPDLAKISRLPGAILLTLTPDNGGTTVTAESSGNPTSIITFAEKLDGHKELPFWVVNERSNFAVLQFESPKPKVIKSYSCAVDGIDQAGSYNSLLGWSLQASNDGHNWATLDSRSVSASAVQMFVSDIPVSVSQPFYFYRIVWLKGPSTKEMLISAVRIVFDA